MIADNQDKIEDEIESDLRSQTIIFLLKNCNDSNEDEIISFFEKNNLFDSPYKIEFAIKSILVAIFYYQNSDFLKNIIINIIKKYDKINPDPNISYTQFLKHQISNFIISYHINPFLFNIHNINLFFKPEKESKLPCLDVVKSDNVDLLQQLLLIDPQLSQKKYHMVSLSRIFGKFQELYLMDFAAYYGSIKIFKFLYLNKEAKYSSNINCFAVAGGNTEIVHICETISTNFDMCLNASIRFHKNDIYDWLIMNKNVKPNIECLLSSVSYHNMALFLDVLDFLINDNKDDDIVDNIHEIVECTIYAFEPAMLQHILEELNISNLDDFHNEAFLAIKLSSFSCFEILIKHFDFSQVENSPTILFYASIKYSNLSFTELILNKYDNLIDYNYQDENGQTILHISVIFNDLSKTGYLLSKCKKNNFDINIKDNSSLTPFFYAVKEGNEEIVKLFLNSKKVRGNDHDQILINYFLITEL